MLSDRDIRQAIQRQAIQVDPYLDELVQPASLEVRLDKYFQVVDLPGSEVYDPFGEPEEHTLNPLCTFAGEPFVLPPQQLVLVSTFEHISLDANIAGRFEGKSSLGRLGLMTHITAGFIDPGFSGHITLELLNVAPFAISLYPGMKIGQLSFFKLDSPAEHLYGEQVLGSHYQGQRGPTASRLHENFKIYHIYDGHDGTWSWPARYNSHKAGGE